MSEAAEVQHGVALLLDIGSTWTKGLAVSLPDGRIIARTQHPTTVRSNIMEGVGAVIAELSRAAPGPAIFQAATSSAAGGLRVAAIGLVPDLTGIAARQASLGAGARVVFTGCYILPPEDIAAIRQERADIILLSGGTDGGNSQVLLENARRLATDPIPAVVVLAGNKSVRSEAQRILEQGGYEVRLTDNVLPTIDSMNVEPAQAVIRNVFIERIVHARGIDDLREWAVSGLVPTPRAVLDAAAFLSDGPINLGMLVVADIGGATTDIHSVGGADPEPGTLLRGLAEPRIKRTVEGDLGLRVSAVAAIESLGANALIGKTGLAYAQLRQEAEKRAERPEITMQDDAFDGALAISAMAEALYRHTGRLESLPHRPGVAVQIGKDLRRARTLIGSGGIFAARADAAGLLSKALLDASSRDRLIPLEPDILVDRHYVLFAVGLLASRYPEAASALARSSFGMESPKMPPDC